MRSINYNTSFSEAKSFLSVRPTSALATNILGDFFSFFDVSLVGKRKLFLEKLPDTQAQLAGLINAVSGQSPPLPASYVFASSSRFSPFHACCIQLLLCIERLEYIMTLHNVSICKDLMLNSPST